MTAEEILDRVTEHLCSRDPVSIEKIHSAITNIVGSKGYVTADDLREWALYEGFVPPHCNFWGAAFRHCPGIKPVGYTKSNRISAKARVIRVWGME